MSRRLQALLLVGGLVLATPGLAHASDYDGRDRDGGYSYRHHHDGDGSYGDDRGARNGSEGDCQSGGCGNKSRRCEGSSGDCRSSFSPGPFKDSPVTIDPTVCMPGSTCNFGPPERDQKPSKW